MSEPTDYTNSQIPTSNYSNFLGNSDPEKRAYQDAMNALENFKKTNYPKQPVQISPTSGFGKFKAQYEPLSEVLTITVKCKFEFVSQPSKIITPEELKKATEEKRAPAMIDIPDDWDKTVMRDWKENFLTQTLNWSSRYFFYCQKDWWEHVKAFVMVKFSEAPSEEPGGPDLIVKVHKQIGIPKSRVKHGMMEVNQLDSNRVLTHEAGHSLGLGDEYIDNDDPSTNGQPAAHSRLVNQEFGYPILRGKWKENSIMNIGKDVMIEHGVAFLEALRIVTGMQEWKFTQKKPRIIPK